MADDVNLRSFPSDRREAVAMEWFRRQDLTGLTPTEAFDLYWNAYKEIYREYTDNRIQKYNLNK